MFRGFCRHKTFEELADEYIAFIEPYSKSLQAANELKGQLGRLLVEHSVEEVVRKDVLVKRTLNMIGDHWVGISRITRTGSTPKPNAAIAHLIPLIDQVIKANDDHAQNGDHKYGLYSLLSQAMQGLGVKRKGSIIYRGYRFTQWCNSIVDVDRVTDLGG